MPITGWQFHQSLLLSLHILQAGHIVYFQFLAIIIKVAMNRVVQVSLWDGGESLGCVLSVCFVCSIY